MNKVQVIDNSQEHVCYKCDGKGSVIENGIPGVVCSTCNGTGKWKEDHYHIVATTPKGKKIAFDSDFGGK